MPPLSTMCSLSHLDIPFYFRFSYYSLDPFSHTPCQYDSTWTFSSSSSFSFSLSYRVAYVVSRYLGLVIYVPKPSPGERQAAVAHRFLSFFLRAPGNCGPHTHTHTLSLRWTPFHDCLPTDSLRFPPPTTQAVSGSEDNNSRTPPPFCRSAHSHSRERGSGFPSYPFLRTLARASRLPLNNELRTG